MSDYKKHRESHLKAQKKYDDKNREKKREYDKKRWQKHKQLQNNWNELKNYLEKQIVDSKACGSQQYYFKIIYDFVQELENRKV